MAVQIASTSLCIASYANMLLRKMLGLAADNLVFKSDRLNCSGYRHPCTMDIWFYSDSDEGTGFELILNRINPN